MDEAETGCKMGCFAPTKLLPGFRLSLKVRMDWMGIDGLTG
jgi:hypothetical protein